MKKSNKIIILGACFAFGLFFSCTTDQNEINDEQNLTNTIKSHTEKMALLPTVSTINSQNRAPISYISELCEDEVSAIHATPGSIGNSEFYDYYSFNGEAGDVISILVERTSPGMDPAFSLYFGTTADNTGVNNGNGGPDMIFLAFRDDEVADPFDSCFSDPFLSGFVLPNTGTYTLAVYDYISCGSPLEYKIITTGIICDSDGDGCPDNTDPHPNSIMDATVIIDGCDSGVPNIFITQCSTMSDLIADIAASANNHGMFVSGVAKLTNSWVKAGLITGQQKGAIQSCAAQSNIP